MLPSDSASDRDREGLRPRKRLVQGSSCETGKAPVVWDDRQRSDHSQMALHSATRSPGQLWKAVERDGSLKPPLSFTSAISQDIGLCNLEPRPSSWEPT
jgi:hypothetical protein